MTDYRVSFWKGARPALVVLLTALGVGFANPEVMETMKDNPLATAAVPLLLALFEAGRNALKPRA